MAFQGISTPRGEINQLLEVTGDKLVGTRINAPFSLNPEVYVLPMDNVLATKVSARHLWLLSQLILPRELVSSPPSPQIPPTIVKLSTTSVKKLHSTKLTPRGPRLTRSLLSPPLRTETCVHPPFCRPSRCSHRKTPNN